MAGRPAAEGRSIPFEADSVRLSAEYGDVAAFHGRRYPAGAVLGFKALALARELLFPRGGSFRDAVEMVLRVPRLRYLMA